MLSLLFDLIFPPRCVACRVILPRGALCAKCRAGIPLHAHLFCGKCFARVPPQHGFARPRCHPSFPYVLGAAAPYHGVMKHLIHALKFEGVRDAGNELGALIDAYLTNLSLKIPADASFVPIPLSRRRRYERGYNQADLIARALSSRTGAPVCAALRRTRHTAPQSHLRGGKARAENVAECFAAISGMPMPHMVILVDDVATSGATLEEAAHAARAAGARHVIALVAAKA